jgi:glycosyltransferase involved in cell wall biosynthesis
MPGPERPTSLLLLTDTAVAGAGGSERFLRNLVAGLPAQRYRIEVLQLSDPLCAQAQVVALADLPHVRWLHHPVGPVYGAAGLAAWWLLRRRVMAGHYDIVQSQHEKADLINALLPRGPRGTVRISNRRDMGFQKTPRLKAAFRQLNGRFDRLVAPTRAILEGLTRDEAASPEQLLCVPNGVDTSRFAPLPAAARQAARAALGYDDQHLVVGCVASLSPVKRHVDLLRAFGALRSQCPQARLLLIGEGPLRSDIESQVLQSGLSDCVRLLGMRQDLTSMLPALDLGVLASSSEGLSNAVLELLSCGVPAVVTSVGGNPDLVTHDHNGMLVAPQCPESMSAALLRALGDGVWRFQAGQQARQTVLAQWSVAAMVQGYERLYQAVLSERSLGRGGAQQPDQR